MNQNPYPLAETIFIIGIGGMGMGPLALYLKQAGYRVSGYDDNPQTRMAEMLKQNGIALTHQIPPEAVVTASNAIAASHPLKKVARENNELLLTRMQMLKIISAQHQCIAISGSHGKTSTTAYLTHALQNASHAFGYLLGGLFQNPRTPPAHYCPESPLLIVELDESDPNFHTLEPHTTALTNLDWDHHSNYPSLQHLHANFKRLFENTKAKLLLPEKLFELAANVPPEKLTLYKSNKDFQVHNKTLAGKIAESLKLPLQADSFKPLPKIWRRQEVLLETPQLKLIADYAHHPSEIKALYHHLQKQKPSRTIAIFQPHRYSRTHHLAAELARALDLFDAIILMPTYSAGESFKAEGSAEAIAKASCKSPIICPAAALPQELAKRIGSASEKLQVLFIGAGDIEASARMFAKDIELLHQFQSQLASSSKLKLHEALGAKTTLRCGGNARIWAEPANTEELAKLIKGAQKLSIPFFIFGRGSNLIVADEGFDGLAIALNQPNWREAQLLENGKIHAGAGMAMKRLCGFAAQHHLSGLENFEGIPGTLGGALYMNAGAMGKEIFDCVESLEILCCKEHCVRQIPARQLCVGYRRCENLANAIALSALIKPTKARKAQNPRSKMDSYATLRRQSQPRLPSAGCTFKNPSAEQSAGALIEKLKLKGTRVGGAEISELHGNFIVNRGNASSQDILELIKIVRQAALKECNIQLEPEVIYLGKNRSQTL